MSRLRLLAKEWKSINFRIWPTNEFVVYWKKRASNTFPIVGVEFIQ